jgi:hypothetical protein
MPTAMTAMTINNTTIVKPPSSNRECGRLDERLRSAKP